MSLDTSGPTALILPGIQIGSLPQTLEWRILSMLGISASMQKDPLAEGLRKSALANLFASSWALASL